MFTPPPGGLASIALRSGAKLPSLFPAWCCVQSGWRDGAMGTQEALRRPSAAWGAGLPGVERVGAAGVSRRRWPADVFAIPGWVAMSREGGQVVP